MGIDRARLPARHELKYYINPAELEALRRRLERVMRLDSHCRGGRAYNVRSLYFDDAFDSAYYDKIDGVMARDKYRLRVYNHSDEVIFLERKRKLGRPRAEKLPARHPPPGRTAHIRRPARALPRRGPASARSVRRHAHGRDAPRRARGVRPPRLHPPGGNHAHHLRYAPAQRPFRPRLSFPRTRPWWPFTTARWRFWRSSSIRISPATSAPCFPALPASAARSPNT